MYCTQCGKENKDGKNFCQYCGTRLTQVMENSYGNKTMVLQYTEAPDNGTTVACPACNRENEAGKSFCKYCGTRLISYEAPGIVPVSLEAVYTETEKYPEAEIKTEMEPEIAPEFEPEIVPEPEPEPESPIETRHVNKIDHRSVKPVHKKKSSLQRKIQGITLNNRILIGVIASLGVILIVLGLSLASYLKTDSFNPVALFNKDETNDVVERDEEAPKITSPKAEDTVKIADAIEVEGTEEKSENDEESAVDVDLFAEFLAGNAKAVVADDFLCSIEWTNEMKPGREYTFQELKDYVLNDEKMSYESFENPEAWYTTINVHGGTMNALRLFYMIKDNEYDEGLYETYVFHDNNGKLEMKFAIDESNFGTGPSNRGGSVDASGVSNYYAHDGAGEGQYSRIYAPDTNFSYKMICDKESHIAFDPAFYDTNNTPMESLNRTMEEAASQNESAHYVRYYREKINNDVYFYYLNDGEEGLTQSTVDFIDAIAAANGFGFDGKATADAAREAYEKELGVYEICQKYTEPQWTDIK